MAHCRAAARVGRARRPATGVPDEWTSPASAGTEPGLQAAWRFCFPSVRAAPATSPAFAEWLRLAPSLTKKRTLREQTSAILPAEDTDGQMAVYFHAAK